MNRRPSEPFRPRALFWRLLFAAALLGVALTEVRAASDVASPEALPEALPEPPRPLAAAERCTACGAATLPCGHAAPAPASWVFRRGRYTHDPATGDRVAQYDRVQAIEPLDDPRLVTSGYSRQRVVLPGPDGSVSTTYRVQSFGSGNGAFDAQAERWHDADRGAFGAGVGFVPPPFYGGGYPWGGWPGPWGPPGPLGGGPFAGGSWGPQPGYAWGNGPNFGRHGGPGYATPYGPADGDAADGYDQRTWRTPDREFYGRDRRIEHPPAPPAAPMAPAPADAPPAP
jgi:hypothetical protein